MKQIPYPVIIIPIALFALLAPFTPFLDHQAANFFFSKEKGFSTSGFVQAVYRWGPWPAWITSLSALYYLLKTRFSKKTHQISQKAQYFAFVMVFCMAVGSGLITNALLKSYWGRPRPIQVQEYGGTHPFRPFYCPNFSKTFKGNFRCRSFPSGHASTGFFFLALLPIGWRLRSKKMIFAGVALSILLGGVLSYARIAAGGHFFSDCVSSALVMWLIAIFAERMANRYYLR